MMDWMVKMLGLPEKFIHSSQEPYGGGVLQVNLNSLLSSDQNFIISHSFYRQVSANQRIMPY
jgi:hypothetical protein